MDLLIVVVAIYSCATWLIALIAITAALWMFNGVEGAKASFEAETKHVMSVSEFKTAVVVAILCAPIFMLEVIISWFTSQGQK